MVITLTCSQCWIIFPDSAAAYGERPIAVNANTTQKICCLFEWGKPLNYAVFCIGGKKGPGGGWGFRQCYETLL